MYTHIRMYLHTYQLNGYLRKHAYLKNDESSKNIICFDLDPTKLQILSSRIQIRHPSRAKRTKTDPRIVNRIPKLTKLKIAKIAHNRNLLIYPSNVYGTICGYKAVRGHTF